MKNSPVSRTGHAIVKWLFFAVLVSTAPILARWWNTGAHFTVATWTEVLSRGELYLIAAALTGEAVGESVSTKAETSFIRILKLISIAGALVIIFIAASAYQHVVDLLDPPTTSNRATIAFQSAILFGASLCVGCSCVSIGANAKHF